MIITCVDCNSSFSVSDGLIQNGGSKVRCSKCDSVFLAYPNSAEVTDELKPEEEVSWELEDLDSELGDFLDGEETAAVPTDGESELDLQGFDDSALEETDLELDGITEATEGSLDLDFDIEDEDMTGETVGSELEDLDFDFASDEGTTADLGTEDELDLADLDFEEQDIAGPQDHSTESNEDINVADRDELDLSDLERSLDETATFENPSGSPTEEFNLDLDSDEQDAEGIAEADLGEETSDGLGISDLGLSDLDLETEEVLSSTEASPAESEELDLSMDLEDEFGAGDVDAAADELDLSDLEDFMEEEKAPVAEAQSEDLDLELELEEINETENASAAGTAEGDAASSLELDMDLDLQMEDSTPASEAAGDSNAEDELDFSDLEQMLESDETPSVELNGATDTEQLDLQLDLDDSSAADHNDQPAANVGEKSQDEDFLDIEQLLDEDEDGGPLETTGLTGDSTELPLEMEAALNDASQGSDAELELDFDLESELQATEDSDLFAASEPNDPLMDSDLLVSNEMDILEEAGAEDTDFHDAGKTSVISTEEFTEEDLTTSDHDYGATQVLPSGGDSDLPIMPSVDQKPAQKPLVHKPPKSRSKKPVLVVGLLILLALGVLTVPNMLGIKIPYISDIKIPYLSDLDVKIPYLSDWLNPEPKDPAGNLKLIPLSRTINGEFVQNSKAGQLFVIQGQIKNDYDHPRSHIRVTGKLYVKGNKFAKAATVYCGNMLSDSELAAMGIAAINNKLGNRFGERRSNVKVKTGKRIPFMIVFDKLPRNLDEYSVEVEASSI